MFENLFGSGKKKTASEPASERQKKFAKKLNVPNAETLSKDEASEQIDKKLNARARNRKRWISHLEGRIEALEKTVAKKTAKKVAKKKKK